MEYCSLMLPSSVNKTHSKSEERKELLCSTGEDEDPVQSSAWSAVCANSAARSHVSRGTTDDSVNKTWNNSSSSCRINAVDLGIHSEDKD